MPALPDTDTTDRTDGNRSGGAATRRQLLRSSAVAAGALALPGTALASESRAHRCSLPTGGGAFERSSPSAVDLDPAGVREAIDFATRRRARSVRVYRHNCLVGTSRLDPVTGGAQRNVWSTTKGVVALLVGRATQLGELSVTDEIGEYITEADDAHGRITIEQLLTQSSGLPLNWTNEVSELPPDTVRYTLGLPFEDEPGTDFEYGQTTVTVLAHAVERAVGTDLQAFAQAELFGPIGIDREDWFWRRDRAGNTHGFAYLYSTPKDLARIGHLALRGGKWGGEQLIAESYLGKATTPSDTNGFYGYLLWLNEAEGGYTVDFPDRKVVDRRLVESAPRDMYMFVGFQDQIIFVIPGLDMVVIRTGTLGNQATDEQALGSAHTADWMHEFFRILMGAVEDEEIDDPGPYEGENDIGFDFQYFVDPSGTAGAAGVGPTAPEDCTAAGCDGEVATEGPRRNWQDALRTVRGNVEDGSR